MDLIRYIPLFSAAGLTSVLLLFGLALALRIVNQVDRSLRKVVERPYTILISRFPDPLILRYGLDQGFLALPNGLNMVFAPWGESLNEALSDSSHIAYANRVTAGEATLKNGQISLRHIWLCRYRGFSVCVVPERGGTNATTDVECLRSGKIAVNAGTDQHRSLLKLYGQLGITPAKDYIHLVDSGQEILDVALKQASDGSDIIGFSGGITERLLAQRLGYRIIAPSPETVHDYAEANSLAYLHPDDADEREDLEYLLDKVEQLWFETVRRVQSEPSVRESFRHFLNSELQMHLGDLAAGRLHETGHVLISQEDMPVLLESWLHFERPLS